MNSDHPPTDPEKALLLALQRGIPITRRPWMEIATPLGRTEADVLLAGKDLFTRGIARRFGAVFDSRRLGYSSTLCAVDVPAGDIERVAAMFQPHPGVTHCYEREGKPDLWFTLTAPADKLDDELAKLRRALAPDILLNLPASRRFKVEVVLDAGSGDVEPAHGEIIPSAAIGNTPPTFDGRGKDLIRKLQGNLPLVEEPFTDIANDLKWEYDKLIDTLTAWKRAGIIRRIGFILRHREAGFVANGMCVWPVAADDVERAGKTLAGAPEVTHCYERSSSPAVPFNLYAMIHARARPEAEATFRRLSEKAGLTGGRMLVSVREFKKSSPVFFMETESGT
ncbi:MAG: hypothetical protein WCL44_07365 [bacterium]